MNVIMVRLNPEQAVCLPVMTAKAKTRAPAFMIDRQKTQRDFAMGLPLT